MVTMRTGLAFHAPSEKTELFDGVAIPIPQATDAHVTIVGNLVGILRPHAGSLRMYASMMQLAIHDPCEAVVYPDVFFTKENTQEVPKHSAVWIIEVMSDTAGQEFTRKIDLYRSLPDLQSYWIFDSSKRLLIVDERRPYVDIYVCPKNSSREIPTPLGVNIDLRDVYENVRFPETTP